MMNGGWIHHLASLMTSLQLFFLGSGIMVLLPGCQLAGHTSPCTSTYWKAFTSRRYSSGFLPTGRSLMEEWRTMPFLSMMQVALYETPTSPVSQRQPQSDEMVLLRSETRGMSMGPSPPSFRGLRVYSMWENLESTETAMSSQPISLNSLALLLKAMISVGQTKVKSRGQKKSTTYLPWQDFRSMSTKSPLYQAGATNPGAGFLISDISEIIMAKIRHTSINTNRNFQKNSIFPMVALWGQKWSAFARGVSEDNQKLIPIIYEQATQKMDIMWRAAVIVQLPAGHQGGLGGCV